MSFFDRFPVQAYTNLELLAQQVVEGFIIGMHKSPFHGFSVEFAEHRIYNTGENTRNIDWKVFARTDKLFTKKYEEETNLRCQIVIDVSSSMYFPEERLISGGLLNKLKFSSVGAACLMNILKKQRDAFGISLFSDKVEFSSQAKSSTTHYQFLLSQLDKWISDVQLNRKSDPAQALHQIAEETHKRSLIVIFSDMFDNADNMEEIFSALQHLKYRKHEVILFHVLDKNLELDFAFENQPYQFVDMETGEKLRMHAHQIRDAYTAKIKEVQHEIESRCIQNRIHYMQADINLGYDYILQLFLLKRKKMN
ncbi:MAG: DUF58 domain-containing protein [Saprospiraceae bacterium]